jgi:hypothetical protein
MIRFLTALGALLRAPIQVARISPALLHADDVIVFEVADARLNPEQVKRLRAMAADVWPGRKVVITDSKLAIRAMRDAQGKEA